VSSFFSYPFDHASLMRNKRRIKEELQPRAKRKLKIYVLSGSTVGELKDLIPLFLLNFGIDAEIRVGDYNTYYEDALFGDNIESFGPDWVYLHTTNKNIKNFPKLSDSTQTVDTLLQEEQARLLHIIEALRKKSMKTIVNNFELPLVRDTGNLSSMHPAGHVRFINQLNQIVGEMIDTGGGVFLNDLNYLSSVVGLDRWYDSNYWHAFKYAISPFAMPWLASSVASNITSAEGAAKKVLLCDLDNTMWGGVIGDDGKEGIELGPESPKGEAFQDVQNYVKSLKDRGIALAVNSKNDPVLAATGFEHEYSVLSKDDFAAFLATWDPKSQNVSQIAKQLNLGSDSFAFIDDNDAEISEVGLNRPEVLSFTYKSSPYELAVQIDRLGVFEPTSLSAEDLKRSNYYQDNQRREQLLQQAGSVDEYLQSLSMSAVIASIGGTEKERAVQLINKTNQFNPTTRRIDAQELDRRLKAQEDIALFARLKDKFGDNGIVSILLADVRGDTAEIDTWVMSCRVFNRQLEHAVFDQLVRKCQDKGVAHITASFRPTAKNGYVQDLYDKLGFECVAEAGDEREYRFAVRDNWEQLNNHIEIEHEPA
jgi:FkbH-like protein